MNILITGAAGFIGFHLAKALGYTQNCIYCLDNLNNYYSTTLKLDRLSELGFNQIGITEETSILYDNLHFCKIDINNLEELRKFVTKKRIDKIIHLAAQAGVRYSFENPSEYIKVNIGGFLNILELARENNIEHVIYASSSSVYGSNIEKKRLHEGDNTDNLLNIYAVSKKTNELMAKAYFNLYGIKSTGLRFFTVYGPWGRPDMAAYIFTKSILDGSVIKVHNNGNLERDFTYIDDIVTGILNICFSNNAELRDTYNIGSGNPVSIIDFIKTIEDETKIKANLKFVSMNKGESKSTNANTSSIRDDFGYLAVTEIHEGIKSYIQWFREYYCKN